MYRRLYGPVDHPGCGPQPEQTWATAHRSRNRRTPRFLGDALAMLRVVLGRQHPLTWPQSEQPGAFSCPVQRQDTEAELLFRPAGSAPAAAFVVRPTTRKSARSRLINPAACSTAAAPLLMR